MKHNTKSLRYNLWLYFALFSGFIFLLLWLLQIVFFNSFYEGMKKDRLISVASQIESKYGQDDFSSALDQITFQNSVLVFITDTAGNTLYTSDEHGFGNQIKNDEGLMNGLPPEGRGLPWDYRTFLSKLSNSEEDYITYTTEERNNRTLIYGSMLDDDTVLYISTPIEAVGLAAEVLKTQLIYVTIVALLLGLIISFFISKKLAKPITNMIDSAKGLATGDYHVQFEGGHYKELDQLATTLNQTTKELSKVEELRRDLLANISHDLRTPLTMIIAYAEMIRDISGEKKEKREAHLRVIIEEGNRLSSLVNDILELSSLQSNSEQLHKENVNLSKVVMSILPRFEEFSKLKGYNIMANITPDQYVLADKSKMERVIYNLIGNGINYIGEDKVLKVNVINLGSKVRFEVIDSGKGIPEEEIPLVWERYYKAKNHKRSDTNNGLGLAIVKSILTLHQAEFGIDSTVGVGSKFWFELRK